MQLNTTLTQAGPQREGANCKTAADEPQASQHQDAAALADQDAAAARSPPSASAPDTAPPPPPRHVCTQWVEAAKSNDMTELRRLLKSWPQLLNTQVGGLRATAAHWAAANGHCEALAQLCLEWGADTGIETETGCLPLHSAAAAGRAECVQLLLAACADPALQLAAVNEDGLTPGALALRHGHTLVQGMLQQAAQGLSQQQQQQEQQPEQPKQQQPTTKQSGMRRGFFSSSCSNGTAHASTAIATGAAAERAPTTAPDDTAIALAPAAAAGGDEAGSTDPPACDTAAADAASDASDAAAVADQVTLQQPSSGRSAEDGACQQQPEPAASPAAAAPPVVERSVGRSWLYAARLGDLACMQGLLLQEPQLLDYRGAGTSYAFVGNSALHWAAAKGHAGCVRWLLQQGAAVAAVNEAGASPLHTALEHGQPGCAEVLVLLGGADVQAVDGYGQSCVAVAAASAGAATAQQLLLWHEARTLRQQDRSAWPVGAMQRLCHLAGRSGDAAKCLERSELVALAADVLAIRGLEL